MSARFAGKTVLVSGASSGLGRCLSLRLAAEGARLILFARREPQLRATAADCLRLAPRTGPAAAAPQVVVGDLTRPADCRRLVAAAEHDGRLDTLLNCAGISMWARFAELPQPDALDALERLMQTNYLGVARLIHGLLPLLQRRHGLICAISSLQARLPIPYHSGYAASKHALEGFLNTLRLEQPEVDILLVYPAWLRGTELRANAIGQPPPVSRAGNPSAVPVERCATRILHAMHRRRRELTVPARYRLLPLLYRLHPAWLERIIRRRVQRQRAARPAGR